MQLIDYKVSQKLTAFYPMNLIYLESRSSLDLLYVSNFTLKVLHVLVYHMSWIVSTGYQININYKVQFFRRTWIEHGPKKDNSTEWRGLSDPAKCVRLVEFIELCTVFYKFKKIFVSNVNIPIMYLHCIPYFPWAILKK